RPQRSFTKRRVAVIDGYQVEKNMVGPARSEPRFAILGDQPWRIRRIVLDSEKWTIVEARCNYDALDRGQQIDRALDWRQWQRRAHFGSAQLHRSTLIL